MNINDVMRAKQQGEEFCENIVKKIPNANNSADVVKMVVDIATIFSDLNKHSIACSTKSHSCSKKEESA